MKPRILILTDPYSKPAFIPRLRFLCDYLTDKGYEIVVYTEAFQSHNFAHSYPIFEKPLRYHNTTGWAVYALWSLLTDYRNRSFTHWVEKQINQQHFDIVFCTTFSTFPLRTACDIAKMRHIPLVTDIRDLEEQVDGMQYQAHKQWWTRPFRKWYRNINIQRRNKALRKADIVTTISPWHVQFIQQFNQQVHLVYNGYDPAQFYWKDVHDDQFLVSYIGKIYKFQDISLIKQAIQELNDPKIVLNLHTPEQAPISITAVGEEIHHSSIMAVLTSKNTRGMMTTKFFEALGCEKPVLCVPSDEGCLAQTIQETNAGIATDNIEEIKLFILDKYKEWQQNGYTHQTVSNKEQFSRQYQAEQFEQIFRSLIHE